MLGVNLKFNARIILVLLVLTFALGYAIDFMNPLTPDPPAIQNSLQWRILVSFIAAILSVSIQQVVLIGSHIPSAQIQFPRPADSPPAISSPSLILDLTCSRLI